MTLGRNAACERARAATRAAQPLSPEMRRLALGLTYGPELDPLLQDP